jgi:putative transposase
MTGFEAGSWLMPGLGMQMNLKERRLIKSEMIKTVTVELLPNNKQSDLLFQSAGVARWSYNWAISRQRNNYDNGGKFISDNSLRKEITLLKRLPEYAWLRLYSNNIPKQAIKDACIAYKRFFKKLSGFPKFKSKRKSKPSFYHDGVKLKFTNDHVRLEKIGAIRLSEKSRIPINAKYTNPRIAFDGLHWYISVGIEIMEFVLDKATEPIGVDLGIKKTAVISDGQSFNNINKTKRVKKTKKRLKRLQRKASKQYVKIKNGQARSKNLAKLERMICRAHKRLKGIRRNYNHQMTATLVRAKPKFVVIEDLNVSGMMKNRHLSKAIQEQGFYEIRKQLEYKSRLNGIRLIVAPRFYPSSKTCSRCGYVHKDLKLGDRTFVCPKCGFKIDRDYQAALNLLTYGLSVVA